MTRKVLMLFAALLFAGLFASCEKAPEFNTNVGPGFTLRVGFDADFPPYGFRDANGELVGFDLDLAAEVARRRGWEIELRPIDWDSKDAELNSGAINCIWNGFTINGREKLYTWSCPYVDNSLVFMVKASSLIKTFKDLAGKMVEVQADSSGLTAINDATNKELHDSLGKLLIVPNYNSAAMELESGICDAVLMDVAVADGFIKDNVLKFRKLDQVLSAEQYGIGFRLGDTVLRDAVEETLREMVADGTFAQISAKWFDGKDVCAIK